MSTFISYHSVCGDTIAKIDVQDIALNRDGVICCDNCRSIVLCRRAWDFLYKKGANK